MTTQSTQAQQEELRECSTIPTDLLTTGQVATKLGVAKSAVYEWLARRDIAHHRVGRLIRIREADVAVFMNRNRVEYAPRRRHGRYPEA